MTRQASLPILSLLMLKAAFAGKSKFKAGKLIMEAKAGYPHGFVCLPTNAEGQWENPRAQRIPGLAAVPRVILLP